MVLPVTSSNGQSNIDYGYGPYDSWLTPNIDITANSPQGLGSLDYGGGNLGQIPSSGLASIDGYTPPSGNGSPEIDLSGMLKNPGDISADQKPWYNRIVEGVKDAMRRGVYDLSHPLRGLQDVIHGVTGINFADGTYTMPDDQTANDFPNIKWQTDPTFNPTGINPLAAASNFIPALGAANLVLQAAGYDPSINFDETATRLANAVPGKPFSLAFNSPGNGGGGGDNGLPPVVTPPPAPQYSAPSPGYASPPVDVTPPSGGGSGAIGGNGGPAGLGQVSSPPPAAVAPAPTPVAPAPAPAPQVAAATGRTYVPYAGDYAHFGEPGNGNGYEFFQGEMAKAAGGRVKRMALGGPLAGPQQPELSQPGGNIGHGVRGPHAPGGLVVPGGGIGQVTSQQDQIRRATMMGYRMGMARGGAAHGGISAPSQMALRGRVSGPGDGHDDSISVALSDNEHVTDANTIGMAGNGSADAGHRVMQQIKEEIRRQAGQKNPKQPPKHVNTSPHAVATMVARAKRRAGVTKITPRMV